MTTELKNEWAGKLNPTNSEKINRAIEQHPLNQVIILAALDKYLEKVHQQDEKPERWGDFLSWEAWKHQSEEIREIIK